MTDMPESCNSQLNFRSADPEDLDALMEFYEVMIEATTGTDNDPMWVSGLHPSRKELREAIDAHSLMVAVIGSADDATPEQIAGAVLVDQSMASGYEQGAWKIQVRPEEVWTIHLFAVHPRYQHRGIARRLLGVAEDYARDHGGRVLRIDVLATNSASLRAYDRLDFDRIGLVHLTYEDPRVTDFILFEKAI